MGKKNQLIGIYPWKSHRLEGQWLPKSICSQPNNEDWARTCFSAEPYWLRLLESNAGHLQAIKILTSERAQRL